MKRKSLLSVFALICGLCITSCSNSSIITDKNDEVIVNNGTKQSPYCVKEAKSIANTLSIGSYSDKQYHVTGYVASRPIFSSNSNKVSFNLVDDLINPTSNLVVFLASSDENIAINDKVVVKAFLHSSNKNNYELSGKKIGYYDYTDCSVSLINKSINNSLNNVQATADTTITLHDMVSVLIEKNEHYPLSDEFIEKYQQNSGGYIAFAKSTGHIVNRQLHEPNQKWHFFESWLMDCFKNNTIDWTDDARSNVYTRLLCPELLLWIYEACDADPVKVKNAKIAAEEGKIAGSKVATIAKNMRACVAFEDLKII